MSKQILTKPQYDVKTFISFLQEMILVGREVGDASTLQIHAICIWFVCRPHQPEVLYTRSVKYTCFNHYVISTAEQVLE